MKYNDFLNGLYGKVNEHEDVKITKKDLKVVMEEFVSYVTQQVKQDGVDVKLPSFGKFYTTVKHNVKVRNPHTGENMIKPKVIRFNFSPFDSLKKELYD